MTIEEWLQPELCNMDNQSLEEELQVILSDNAGESEYVQSLHVQIMRLKVSLPRFLREKIILQCIVSVLLKYIIWTLINI